MSYLHGLYGATSKKPKSSKKKHNFPKVKQDDFGFFDSVDESDNSEFPDDEDYDEEIPYPKLWL